MVVNSDGHIGYWKPGSNYKVTLPLNSSGSKVPKRVKVADAWDDSYKKVDVEEAEALPASPSSKGTSAAAAAPPPPPKAAPPPPAAAAASSSAPASGAAQPKAAAQAPPAAAPPPPPPQQGKQQQQQPAAAAQQAAPSNGAGPSQKPQNGIPRATSPRSGSAPAGFAAITSIPAIHPTLMAEQERLEDGVSPGCVCVRTKQIVVVVTGAHSLTQMLSRTSPAPMQVKMSLEDLQNQMDKHQQLRERTDGK